MPARKSVSSLVLWIFQTLSYDCNYLIQPQQPPAKPTTTKTLYPSQLPSKTIATIQQTMCNLLAFSICILMTQPPSSNICEKSVSSQVLCIVRCYYTILQQLHRKPTPIWKLHLIHTLAYPQQPSKSLATNHKVANFAQADSTCKFSSENALLVWFLRLFFKNSSPLPLPACLSSLSSNTPLFQPRQFMRWPQPGHQKHYWRVCLHSPDLTSPAPKLSDVCERPTVTVCPFKARTITYFNGRYDLKIFLNIVTSNVASYAHTQTDLCPHMDPVNFQVGCAFRRSSSRQKPGPCPFLTSTHAHTHTLEG